MTNHCFPLRRAFLLLLCWVSFLFLLSSTSKLTVLIFDVSEYDIYIVSLMPHDSCSFFYVSSNSSIIRSQPWWFAIRGKLTWWLPFRGPSWWLPRAIAVDPLLTTWRNRRTDGYHTNSIDRWMCVYWWLMARRPFDRSIGVGRYRVPVSVATWLVSAACVPVTLRRRN